MLKKIALIGLLLYTVNGFGQVCTPDQSITEPGIYPEQLDVARPDLSYDMSLQILALEDTMVLFAGATVTAQIDSIVLDTVVGLPQGFTYACNPASCTFNHTAVGCVNISGNPTLSDTGIYLLEIQTTVYARLGSVKIPVKDTVEDFVLLVSNDSNASVTSVQHNPVSVYPNPSNGQEITITSDFPLVKAELSTLDGRLLYTDNQILKNKYTLEVKDYSSGMYLLKIYTHLGLQTVKLRI